MQLTGREPKRVRPEQTSGDRATTQPQQSSGQGQAIRDAARGAAFGSICGAIAGNAGTDAAADAAMGGLAGGLRRREAKQRQAAQQQQQQATAASAGRDTYNRAMAACLQGRGYTVN